MFFLNLSLGEFLALFAGVSGLVTALYLLDRARQKHRVATLRFWVHSEAPSEMQHRRKIQQPWSLLLQIASLLCLLTALAQLRCGSPLDLTRDHVLILDSSAVMNARTNNGKWIDQARSAAKTWLSKVPKGDRVMLVRADTLATAATAFETNHKVIEEAITHTQPSPSALRLNGAVKFARQAQRAANRRAGEIVYAGAGRIAAADSTTGEGLEDIRFLPVKAAFENIGVQRVGLRRSSNNENLWQVYVTVRNDGTRARTLPLTLLFGGAPLASRAVVLAGGAEQSVTFDLKTESAGLLEARIQPNDLLPDDDRAILELPKQTPVSLVVYSNEPSLLKPVFSSHPRLDVQYRSPGEYSPAAAGDVVVFDRFAPQPPEKAAAIWIDPPKSGSPVAIVSSKSPADLTRWHNENPLAAGLRTRDVKVDRTSVFQAATGDIAVVDTQSGPAILARPSKRLVVLGFHPMLSPLRFELATPLLFANIIRWMSPEVFLSREVHAGSAGGVIVPLDSEPAPGSIKVSADGVGPVPFTIDGKTLRFFAGSAGIVRIVDGRREIVYSLTLPEVATAVWQPSSSVRTGIPDSLDRAPLARDLWQWLAILGALGLLVEWMLYGRARRLFIARKATSTNLRKAS